MVDNDFLWLRIAFVNKTHQLLAVRMSSNFEFGNFHFTFKDILTFTLPKNKLSLSILNASPQASFCLEAGKHQRIAG